MFVNIAKDNTNRTVLGFPERSMLLWSAIQMCLKLAYGYCKSENPIKVNRWFNLKGRLMACEDIHKK